MENLIRTDILQKVVNEGRIEWLKHSLERMMERGISRNEVKQVLVNGEIIEEYLYDKPHPSALFFGWAHNKPLHVVAALDKNNRVCHVITTYIPDAMHFEPDFKTRKNDKTK